jgi:cobalt-zinc-cadmium efflux system protein
MAGHSHNDSRVEDRRKLAVALALILAFLAAEVTAGLLARSLALLSDAAHMLTDAAALAMSLVAARLATRPARGAMTFGMGRAEILSAQANGATLLVLSVLIIFGAIVHLVRPPHPDGTVMLIVAGVGVVVNLIAARVLAGTPAADHGHAHGAGGGTDHDHDHRSRRSLNIEGSYKHILTDLYGFIGTVVAGIVIVTTGFRQADSIASLVIALLMLWASFGLLKASWRIFMEAAPAGLMPDEIGRFLAEQPGVVEVHDLHVWEVTSDFPALSAHVIVRSGDDCHAVRRQLERVLDERFGVEHTTLQVEHEIGPLTIQVPSARSAGRR